MPLSKRHAMLSAVGGPPPSYPEGGSATKLAEAMASYWEERIGAVLPQRPDLILLPEMCDRYVGTPSDRLLDLRLSVADVMVPMLSRLAKENACYIAHPTALQSTQGLWHNGVRLVDRSGEEVVRYYKNFLVSTEIERGLSPGSSPAVYDCDFGRVGFAICFDLNFCELLEAYQPLNPDLMLFPSNYHGGLMQPYWAYQLRTHFLGCMGQAPIRSSLYSPVGSLISSSTNYFHHLTAAVNTDYAVVHLDFHWKKLRALQERYGKKVTVSDPGELGAVLVSCEDDATDVQQMLAEFEIETLDAYLAHSRLLNSRARSLHL